MLERLKEIDWSKLSHAYGPAIDLPDQLRALISKKPEAWKKAVWELHGNVWHQGTVYEASAYVVPFLVEIVRDGALSDECRAELLGLLALIANGESYIEVHHRSRTLSDPAVISQLERERGWVKAAKQAVAHASNLYMDLLLSPHQPTHLLAAYLLGLCRPDSTEVVETLMNGGVRLE